MYKNSLLLTILLSLVVMFLVYCSISLLLFLYKILFGKEGQKKLNKWKTQNVYIPNTEARKSFYYAMDRIQEHFADKDYFSNTPLYILSGEHMSGKKAILKNLNIKTLEEISIENSICSWHIYDKAIIIQFKGDSFEESDHEWSALINLLKKYRNNRVVDGLILSVSSESIFNESIDKLSNAANDNLSELQNIAQIRFPIYIIVTKCDKISGFTEFCSQIPSVKRQNIFGWSSPYKLDTKYQNTLTDEIFSYIGKKINHIQEEIFTISSNIEINRKVFSFLENFLLLKSSIKNLIDNLFKDSKSTTSFFLRGVYFIGDEINSAQNESMEKHKLLFVNDVFKDKIFEETNTILPLNPDASKSKTIFKKLFVLSLTILAFFVGKAEIDKAYYKSRNNISAVKSISHNIQTINAHERIDNSEVFISQIVNIINQIDRIHDNDMRSYLLPFSIRNNITMKTSMLLSLIYEKYIFNLVYDRLINEINRSISHFYNIEELSRKNSPHQTIFDKESFKIVYGYLKKMSELQDIIIKWNNLSRTKSLGDLSSIINSLFKYNLSQILNKNKKLYSKIMDYCVIQKVDINKFKPKSRPLLIKLYNKFLDDLFSIKNTLHVTNDLVNNMNSINDNESLQSNLFVQILENMSDLLQMLSDESNAWIHKKKFEPGGKFNEIIALTTSSDFFEPEDIDIIVHGTDKKFRYFKRNLHGLRTNLIERLFDVNLETGHIKASNNFHLIYGALNLLATQSFINVSFDKTNIPEIKSENELILFSKYDLEKCIENIEEYIDKMPKILKDFNTKHKHELNVLTKLAIDDYIKQSISESVQIINMDKYSLNMDDNEKLSLVIDNFNSTIALLIKFIENGKSIMRKSTYEKIVNLLVKHCNNILEYTDKILLGSDLYAMKHYSFESWEGHVSPVLYAYNLRNKDQLSQYLASQRGRLIDIVSSYSETPIRMLKAIYKKNSKPENIHYEKWSKILDEIKNYNGGDTNNPIVKIEKFLGLIDSSNLNYNQIKSQLKFTTSYNIFSREISKLGRKLLNRLIDMKIDNFSDNFSKIRDYFNDKLAGKFPFCNMQENNSEVSITEMQEFLAMLNDYQNIFEVLNKNCPIKVNDEAYRFIKQIKLIITILTYKNNKIISKQTCNFRSKIEKEANTKYLTEWVVNCGDNKHSITDRDSFTLDWSPGDVISILFKFANNSPAQTLSGSRTALFTYRGNWSILRLLFEQSDKSNNLKFQIRLANDSNKNIFTRIFMSMPGLKSSIKEIRPPVYCPNIQYIKRKRSL